MALQTRWLLTRALRSPLVWISSALGVAWIPLLLRLSPGSLHAMDLDAEAAFLLGRWAFPGALAGVMTCMRWCAEGEPFLARLETRERWAGEALGLWLGGTLPCLVLALGVAMASGGHQHGVPEGRTGLEFVLGLPLLLGCLGLSLSLAALASFLLSLPGGPSLKIAALAGWSWLGTPDRWSRVTGPDLEFSGLGGMLRVLGVALVLLGLSLGIRAWRDRDPSEPITA